MTESDELQAVDAMLDEDAELQAEQEAFRREYGTYVANQRIPAGNALAYDVGHQVPVSNVVRHGYWFAGQVDLVDGAEHAPQIAAAIAARAAKAAPPPGVSIGRAATTATTEQEGNE